MKTIIFLADGTWNGSGIRSLEEKDKPELSNVYRLYLELQGDPCDVHDGGIGLWSQEKRLKTAQAEQLALYCHGVGENLHNPAQRWINGALGGGTTTRIRLGYAFISKNYESGDRIVIIGFSRGSYESRALADMIATQGLLDPKLADEHHTLSYPAGAWLAYRRNLPQGVHPEVAASEALHLQAVNAIGRIPRPASYVPDTHVHLIGIFDTVGSIGLPLEKDSGGYRADDFKYVKEDLCADIDLAFHSVSADEERFNFAPTYWRANERPQRLTQTLFPGAHSDVGGGFADHHLADVALGWMFDRIKDHVTFKADHPVNPEFGPDPLGLAHRPWILNLFSGFGHARRSFAGYSFAVSNSCVERSKAVNVPIESADGGYALESYTAPPP